MSWRLSVPFFLPTFLPAGRPFPWAGRYSPHSSLTLHLLLYRNGESLSSFFCAYLQLFCCHYHRDLKCQDKNAESIILCLKYYFRLSPHLRDYMVYAMTIFLTWMVGRAGVEPAQPRAGDLQSLGLTTCSVSPYLVGVAGFEPATFCVLNRCSPIWAKHL